METTTRTLSRGVWQTDKQPSSLIINFFEITDIIKNEKKVSCLLNNVKKEVSLLAAFGIKKINTVSIPDHGLNWSFDITIDADGNYGLLFTGLNN
jgi:hypothetical protein